MTDKFLTEEEHYAQLEGYTVKLTRIDDGVPQLLMFHPETGRKMIVSVLMDAEGNGGGHLDIYN